MQCMDVTNSTKFRLPLLSLSNVENIKVETFSTVSTGSNKLNISCTFTFSNVPFKIFEYLNNSRINPRREPRHLRTLEDELAVPLPDVLHPEPGVGDQELHVLLGERHLPRPGVEQTRLPPQLGLHTAEDGAEACNSRQYRHKY